MPAITHCTDDEFWGQIGSSKKVYAAKSLTFAGGEVSTDKIHIREENKYWKIEVCDFKSWMLGFYSFAGEWSTTDLESNEVQIDYTYTLFAKNGILFPLNYLFAHLFWKTYMKQVLENVRKLANDESPYLYK